MRNRLLVLVFVMGLIVSACGDDSGEDTSAETPSEENSMDMEGDDMDMGEHEFAFGEPADATDADREIEVVAKDDFSYEPAALEIARGETVTFVVTNEGEIVHEFILGDESYQDEHEAEMAEMEDQMMHDDPNAIDLEPGETKELSWTFTEAGELLYACHEPGHYEAGMIGTIMVE